MGKIFCIMGKAGTEKKLLFDLLREHLRFRRITPYISRKPKEGELNGVHYHFVTSEYIQSNKDLIFDYIKYPSWEYALLLDQEIQLDQGNYLTVCSLEAFLKLKTTYGEDNVIPIYLVLTDEERIKRLLRLEKEKPKGNYVRMCETFLADQKQFSNEKLKESGIIDFFSDMHSSDVFNRVKKQIESLLENS